MADSEEDSEMSESEYPSGDKNYRQNSPEKRIGTSISINAQSEVFQEHLKHILVQIELFENGFQEFNEIITDTKEFEKIDLSDLRNIFEILKSNSIDKEHFKYFLHIMQQLLLIPDTDRGIKIWKSLSDIIVEIVTGTKQGIFQ